MMKSSKSKVRKFKMASEEKREYREAAKKIRGRNRKQMREAKREIASEESYNKLFGRD